MLEGHVGKKKPKVKNKSLKTCKTKGGGVEKYLKEADVPLVGYFANDTENRFTAGIDNNSEEIKKKKFTSVTWSHSNLNIMFCHFPVLL